MCFDRVWSLGFRVNASDVGFRAGAKGSGIIVHQQH